MYSRQPTAADHKAQLANLSKTDPEFYQFLQEEDNELLQFSGDDYQSDNDDNLSQSDQSIMPVIIQLHHVIWMCVAVA